jgi:hypothetical protein
MYTIGHVKHLQIGSSFCSIRFPGYHKETNHFILPVLIRYVDNKQNLRDNKFAQTKFLKRQIYGYFYNNLRIDKSDKLTRKELNESFRKERIRRSKEYQKLIEDNGWSKADLARHLGVSRAWVTMVMREVK